MRTSILSITCLLISTLTHGQCPGIEQWDNPAHEVKGLNAIFAASEDTVYAVDWNGGIMKTTNGGNSWQRKGTEFSNYLTDLHFIDGQTGWVVGYYNGVILKTNDGGESWTQQYKDTAHNLTAVQFINGQHGWAIGDSNLVLHTTDGGQNWQQHSLPDSVTPSAFHFTNQNNGWIVSYNGNIWHSSNGGDQWNLQDTNSQRLNDVYFTSQDKGWHWQGRCHFANHRWGKKLAEANI